ncbi:MAG TPA: aspartate kinase [Bacteroidota bacterium]|jgi:aspartate kinase
MIVMKFGGTSTQDAEAVGNVVRIVRDHLDKKPLVVISAIARATNMLEQAGRFAADGKPGESRDALLKLFERHYDMTDALIKDRQRHHALRAIIGASLKELEELLKGVVILRELTPRALDTIYSYGELLSSRIVAVALEESGIPSQWIDTKEFMVTDDRHNAASPVMEILMARLPEIVSPLTGQGIVPVTQGYIGVTRSGHRTTMGRESSDYSASVMGAALAAEDVQIWTDVDGILTADPRVVPAPRKVRALSFEEAFDLSYFGAKVLHPKTVLPALERNIPIHVYNSRRANLAGTLITKKNPSDAPSVKSIAFKRDMTLLTVTPKNRYGAYIFWGHVHNVLTEAGAIAYLTASSDYGLSVVLDSNCDLTVISQGLKEIGSLDLHGGKGIVCLVGTNISAVPKLVERVFGSVSEYPVSMISFGASRSNLCFVIDDDAIPDAVVSLHSEFFDTVAEDAFEILEHFKAPLQQG